MNDTPFKLMCESLGLSVKETAQIILRIPLGTAAKYAAGERRAPIEIMNTLSRYIAIVDSTAKTFIDRPAMLDKTELPRCLHKAVYRRMIEIKAIKRHLKQR